MKANLGYEFIGWDTEISSVTHSITYQARYNDLVEEVRKLTQYELDFSGAKIYDLTDTLKQINPVIEIRGKGTINSLYEETNGENFRVGTYKGKVKTSKTGLNVTISYKEKALSMK